MNTICPHCQKPVADALKFTTKHRRAAGRILAHIDASHDMRQHMNQRLHLVPMFVSKVAAHNGLTLDELLSESRRRERVQVRHVLMWFLSQNTSLALVTIAAIFNRHHASVVHARKQIPKLMSVGDPDTVAMVDMVMEHAIDIWTNSKPQTL
tara:strand:- start:1421 stop:1876 length:456 start_codon:yes stop_codon:yes gene_type:complete